MDSVFEKCPKFESHNYILRYISSEDCADLLNVYSDKAAVPFFNSDNCDGDDFYYRSSERMAEAIKFWDFSYGAKFFVRWSIIHKAKNIAIGTIY